MRIIISIITLFPETITPFLNHSIIKQAQKKKQVSFNLLNPRDFTQDQHRTVDDRPYGGGAGMLLRIEPLVQALEAAEKKNGLAYKILLTPQGELWNQALALKLVKISQSSSELIETNSSQFQPISNHLLLICGHYEGIDARIKYFIDQEISVGNYILSGGEAAAVVVIDSLVRLIPGVLKKSEATRSETFMEVEIKKLYQITKDKLLKEKDINSQYNSQFAIRNSKIRLIEYPQYTRPEDFRGLKVPKVLLSGDHKKIKEWRLRKSWEKTKSQISPLRQGFEGQANRKAQS